MRHSVYWELMNDEFGSIRAASLHTDLALSSLGSLTAQEALEQGEDPKAVWLAVCDAAGVPESRRLGTDKKPHSNPF
ncbi:DUF3046 domain-containing protein [Brevibacterium sp. UMB10442]|nr:DUF3046 domain-containing protein [Brevibacterium sp. UMB10442]